MNKWAKKLSTTTLAATLTLGAVTLGVTPAAADTGPNSSCTARSASGGAKNLHPFGRTTVSGVAQGLAQDGDQDTNFGRNVIGPEVHADKDACPTPGG